MAEKFRFMDPVQLPDGTYDREYNAQEFTDYFKALITTGVMKSVGNQLAVTTNGSNMITRIDTGVAFILGRYYENDSFKELTHDTETLGNSRIDRIVVRLDLSTEARYVRAFIKKGLPSTNPVAPSLTQTPNLYEISLAQVKVVGGQTFIPANAVTDERGTNIICPWAGSKILPSFDDNALAQHIDNRDMHTTAGEKNNWNYAFTQVYDGGRLSEVCKTVSDWDWNLIKTNGYYMGSNTLNSPDGVPTDRWYMGEVIVHNHLYVVQRLIQFTEPSLKTYERACIGGNWQPWRDVSFSTLFQSVSNGKAQVANAITQKGVPTSPTAEFATMANNIMAIQTGKKFARGVASSANVEGRAQISAQGLDFIPTLIIASKPNSNPTTYVSTYASGNAMDNVNAQINMVSSLVNGNILVGTPALQSIAYGSFSIIVASQYDGNSTGAYNWIALEI